MPTDPASFFQSLEAKGEDAVRLELATRRYNEQRSTLAREWLAQRERTQEQRNAALDHEHKVEEVNLARDALAAARESNRIAAENLIASNQSAAAAKTQARWAIWAAIIAVVAALVSAHEAILKLVSILM